MSDPTPSDLGARLVALERRLRLLLQHLAGRAVRARVQTDDLVQEVWLRALGAERSLPAAEPGDAALWRFLSRLARNTVVDVARSMRTARRSGPTVPLARSDWTRAGVRESRILADTLGPATRVTADETSRRVLERFDALAPEHRRVIGLRQLEGLSARETALRMGRTETAIHSLYRRALIAWERALETAGGDLVERIPGSRDESGAQRRPEGS